MKKAEKAIEAYEAAVKAAPLAERNDDLRDAAHTAINVLDAEPLDRSLRVWLLHARMHIAWGAPGGCAIDYVAIETLKPDFQKDPIIADTMKTLARIAGARVEEWRKNMAEFRAELAKVNEGKGDPVKLGDMIGAAKAGWMYGRQYEARYYRIAAERGDVNAMVKLAGSLSDPADKLKWFQKAADAGGAAEWAELGWWYSAQKGDADRTKGRALIERAAAAGDSYAMLTLAREYDEDNSLESQAKAYEWYEKAGQVIELARRKIGRSESDTAKALAALRRSAQAGSVDAMLELADHYMGGEGVPKDEAEAQKWFEAAYSRGGAKVAFIAGEAFAFAKPPELSKARAWYEKAAAGGSAEGMIELALMLDLGRGGPQDTSAAKGWFEKAIRIGEPWTISSIASKYDEDESLPDRRVRALPWKLRAANAGDDGDSSAMQWLGRYHIAGWGGKKDEAAAQAWFEKAAADGFRPKYVLQEIAQAFEKGEDVEKDEKRARVWYRRAADLGDSDCMVSLAWMLETGRGGDRDERQAQELLVRSVEYRRERDRDDACMSIGASFSGGHDVPASASKAFSWYHRGAEAGYKQCMLTLSQCYLEGKGVAVDEGKAKQWLERASKVQEPN